jgi:putative exosortase-associated protein (TIGR04073 family)
MKAIKTTSVSALFAGLFFLLMTCNALADTAEMRDNPGVAPSASLESQQHRSYGTRVSYKLLRGLANVGTGIIELPKNVINATNYQGVGPYQNSNLIWGLTGGSVKGVANFIGRMGVGLYDVLTFPFPTHPVATPVLPWQQFYQDTSYGNIFQYDDGSTAQ